MARVGPQRHRKQKNKPVEEVQPSEVKCSTDHVPITITLQTCIWEVPGSDRI